ncbi:hypothetical protein MRS44_018657 [Fusarium solani]|uniref:uncharacterized protein n=1 Tax=Fusarium solani TaxID=169388 RepID=UPI0032C46269|nr:hypothetical protein MRS44_018657 [Fusarium solani]
MRVPPAHRGKAPLKPRLLVLTDISPPTHEPDDLESLVHLLASVDLFEIEGIISTSGASYNGSEPLATNLIFKAIDAYEKDLPNLSKRSKQTRFLRDETVQTSGYWPSPQYLRSVTREGMQTRGNASIGLGKGNAGTQHIVDVADQPDPRPVFVTIWGGANSLAQAFLEVKHNRSDKDPYDPYTKSSAFWLRQTFKDLFYIWNERAWSYYSNSNRDVYWPRIQKGVQEHGALVVELRSDAGSLGKPYPNFRYGVEGDTPSFTYLWPGLNDPQDPTQASFGGQFAYNLSPDNVTCVYSDNEEAVANRSVASMADTMEDQLNNFFSRMDWAAHGSGNRNPNLVLNRVGGYDPVVVKARVNRGRVSLSAQGSSDPDGNKITYSWHHDAGTGYTKPVKLHGNKSKTVSVEIPPCAAGQDIHIILRGVDNGTPPLASYRRAIIRVKH